ncbi:ABC transporter ATP-binding protein [Haloimpatiens sp. FM7315]|uniref:ABC transporter ATP-binding protein n=1 Tax=Haloimpatiens sp. FM7315 TaxID=3298609 RepID=UPI00370C655B
MGNILELKDVSYVYNSSNERVNAVKNANASFENGKLYAITGRSGSGKTTLLSLMAGLDNVSEGSILFKGKPLNNTNRNYYRSHQIGVIFQSFNLLPHLTALENVMLSLEIAKFTHKDRKKRALDLLTKVGISKEEINRRVLKLSGGQQQRIAIARALAPNPELILADEPTGNLDNDTGNAVISLLLDIAHKENKVVVMITHSKSIADMCDEIYGMKDGKLLPIKVT